MMGIVKFIIFSVCLCWGGTDVYSQNSKGVHQKLDETLDEGLSEQREKKAQIDREEKEIEEQEAQAEEDEEGDEEKSEKGSYGASYVTEADVMAALAFSKKKSPQVYEDSLRVWKKYRGKTVPHYNYRYWARDIVIWLRSKKGYVFDSEDKVAAIFQIMKEKKMISVHAAVLLTADAWSYLVHQDGVPRFKEKETPGGGMKKIPQPVDIEA